MSAIDDEPVRNAIRSAWEDSRPGADGAHEEGGFVLRSDDGLLSVERWPHGQQREIVVPTHENGFRSGKRVVATFHTHPNPGEQYQQEPSVTDVRAVRDDPHLRHADYEGEFVIASELTYRILPDGSVEVVGKTADTVLRV